MVSGVYLAFADIGNFSPSTRLELQAYMTQQLSSSSAPLNEQALTEDDEAIPDLSVSHARRLTERVSEKLYATVRYIAESDASGFNMTELMKVLGIEHTGDLRGVWGGITKRTRKVIGDDTASLIWWVQNEDGDWIGRVSQMTHRSLRKVFDIK